MTMTAPQLTETDILRELEPVVESNLERHLQVAKEWMPHEYVPWTAGARLRRRAGRRGVGPGAVQGLRRGPHQPDREPAHRGQPAELPPRDRDRLRPRRRVGDLGAPVDRRGGPARDRHPRLPARDACGRPGRDGAGADDAHGRGLRVGQPRRPAAVAGLRLVPGAGDAHLAPQHRQADRGPDRRPAARPDRAGREPAHALLPQPAGCVARAGAQPGDARDHRGGQVVRDARVDHRELHPQVGADRAGRCLRPAHPPRRRARSRAARVGCVGRARASTPTARPARQELADTLAKLDQAASRFEEKRSAHRTKLADRGTPMQTI